MANAVKFHYFHIPVSFTATFANSFTHSTAYGPIHTLATNPEVYASV